MDRYKVTREQVLSPVDRNEDLIGRCMTPPMHHRVSINNGNSGVRGANGEEDDEPYVILHAGPHKTGTTALQAFIYDLEYATNGTTFLKDNLRVPTYDELPGVFGKEGVGLNLPHCSILGFKLGGGSMVRFYVSCCIRVFWGNA